MRLELRDEWAVQRPPGLDPGLETLGEFGDDATVKRPAVAARPANSTGRRSAIDTPLLHHVMGHDPHTRSIFHRVGGDCHLPNGGSDCCGTCWFNPRARAAAEQNPASRELRHFCEIRQLPIERAFWTYCANHPHRSPEPDRIPIGPVLVGHDLKREVWKPSPDTDEIRRHVLELLAEIGEPPANEYPMGTYKDEIVVWQAGEFRDARAIPDLERIARFDPAATTGAPFNRTRGPLVQMAREALAKLR
jgi:hypothetical protein